MHLNEQTNFSLVISTRNRAATLPQALESLLALSPAVVVAP